MDWDRNTRESWSATVSESTPSPFTGGTEEHSHFTLNSTQLYSLDTIISTLGWLAGSQAPWATCFGAADWLAPHLAFLAASVTDGGLPIHMEMTNDKSVAGTILALHRTPPSMAA